MLILKKIVFNKKCYLTFNSMIRFFPCLHTRTILQAWSWIIVHYIVWCLLCVVCSIILRAAHYWVLIIISIVHRVLLPMYSSFWKPPNTNISHWVKIYFLWTSHTVHFLLVILTIRKQPHWTADNMPTEGYAIYEINI